MNKDQLRARDEFVCALTKCYPLRPLREVMNLVDDLLPLARASQINSENLCNLANYTDRRDSISKRVQKVLDTHQAPLEFHVGGDPRGFTLKFKLPTGEYNSWGGKEEGWGL